MNLQTNYNDHGLIKGKIIMWYTFTGSKNTPMYIVCRDSRFYKSKTVATMVGGPKDFGGTKELGVPKCKSEQTAGGTKKLNVLLKTEIDVHCELISSCVDYLLLSSELSE